MSKIKNFLKKKDIEFSMKRYGIDALSAMAQGLFASLLIGTIISTIGTQFDIDVLTQIGGYAKQVSGPAMAVAIAYALKCPPLVLFSMVTVGFAANALGGAGGPLAVLVVAIIASECGKLVSKETKVDIIVTPAVTILVGVLLSIGCAKYIGDAAMWTGDLIGWATEQQPLIMGIVVSVVVGIALTLPISSAAICAAIALTGYVTGDNGFILDEGKALAGGAALAGCCANMVGFAVMSFKENGVGGLISQGLGTSMLQMGNIVKKPVIWLPPIITSAITGPLATCVFKVKMFGDAISSGMGTCGLVGPIGVYSGWVRAGIKPGAFEWIGLICISVVLPAVITMLIGWGFRKAGIIKDGDLKLEN